MSYKVEKLTDAHVLGEGPHWDEKRQALFYVDAIASTINRYLPSEKRLTTAKLDSTGEIVSIVIPIKDTEDKFLATIGHQIVIVTWDGESSTPSNIKVVKTVDKGEPGKDKNHFNDGKVDPTGRLWIGTLGGFDDNGVFEEKKGSLYSFSKDFTPTKHEKDITIANGLAWSSDLKTMYYIDTPTKRIDAYDFDAQNGTISNKRVAFDFSTLKEIPQNGGADGMTIDTDDNLWVAVFGAAGVYQIDPRQKKILRKIDIPSLQTTSVAFGGPNLDELYVVSAKFNFSPEMEKQYPAAGSTFRVTGLGVRGLPMLPVSL